MPDGPGGKPKKPKKPPLPKDAPADLKGFVDCKATKVTLGGKVGWIPKLPEVTITAAPGADPDSVTITVSWGVFSFTVSASVKDGKLSVDTSKFPDIPPFSDAKEGTKDWVDKLNAWLGANGFQLGQPQIAGGKVTLTKVAAAAPGKAGKVGAGPTQVQKAALIGGILLSVGGGIGIWAVASDGGAPPEVPAVAGSPAGGESPSSAPTQPLKVKGHEFHDEELGESFVVVCIRNRPNTTLDITVTTPTGEKITTQETTDQDGLLRGEAEITGIGPGTYRLDVVDPATGEAVSVPVPVGEEEGEPGCPAPFE